RQARRESHKSDDQAPSDRGSIGGKFLFPWLLAGSPGFLLTLWLLVPFTLIFTVSKLGKPMLQERYLLISMAPAYVLLARAAMQLPSLATSLETRRVGIQLGATLVLCLAFAV